MKLIREAIEDFQYLTEEKDGKKSLVIEGIFLQGNLTNRNKRYYPIEVLDKEVGRYNESHIAKNRAFGELGHPQGPTINLDRVSHMITSLRKEGTNYVGRAKIFTETPMGSIVKNLIENGGQLGVSSRGLGSLVEKNGINEVQSDFYLATAADIVSDPSAPNAFVQGIMESQDWVFDERYGWKAMEVAERAQTAIKENRLTEEQKLSLLERWLDSVGRN